MRYICFIRPTSRQRGCVFFLFFLISFFSDMKKKKKKMGRLSLFTTSVHLEIAPALPSAPSSASSLHNPRVMCGWRQTGWAKRLDREVFFFLLRVDDPENLFWWSEFLQEASRVNSRTTKCLKTLHPWRFSALCFIVCCSTIGSDRALTRKKNLLRKMMLIN